MGGQSWFTHPASGIDAAKESDASRMRDPEAWAILISRLVDVCVAPYDTLEEDHITATPALGYFQSRKEAMVYRLVGNPPKPQVLVMREIKSNRDLGAL